MYRSSIIGLIPDLPDELTVTDGEPAEELHVTLVYLTDDHTTLTPAHRAAIGDVLRSLATPITAPITGVRTLGADEPPATVLVLDSPELQDLRPAVKAALEEAGVPVPEDTYPTYIPHITVGYGTSLEDAAALVGRDVTLNTLAAFYGPERDAVTAESPTPQEEAPMPVSDAWTAVLARIGTPTGDGRIIAPGALTHRTLPLPLMWQHATSGGHDGAVVVGRIDSIDIDPSGMVLGHGVLLNVAEAYEVRELITNGVIGPSVDLDDTTSVLDDDDRVIITEGRISGATLVPIPAFAEVSISLDVPLVADAGEQLGALVAAVREQGWADMPIADAARAWDGQAARDRVAEWATGAGDEIDYSKFARAFLIRDDDADPNTLGAYSYGLADVIDGTLTVVPRAVFAAAAALEGARGAHPVDDADAARAVLSGLYGRMDRTPPWDEAAALIAAATPVTAPLPPAGWFKPPRFSELTPLTVLPNGRVFGHIAPWDQCYVGLPGCRTAPRSPSGYAYFLTHAQRTAEGHTVPVGALSVGQGHAGLRERPAAAMRHYEDVATVAARVNVGEDEFGIWCAGVLVPGLDEVLMDRFVSSPLSGDWRPIGGALELIAACSVNTPGFPIPRTRAVSAFAAGEPVAFIAPLATPERVPVLSEDDHALIASVLADTARSRTESAARARWAWAQVKGQVAA